ncbi:RICIN domain-containing protein [Streptomyces flavalbus]|uniref:Ricin-type beta-trefoil lectin domain protein n=1 Tax=Streptomyces flavalbus TaxID=2665155 RepID=A0ABW2W3C6_9ACTN
MPSPGAGRVASPRHRVAAALRWALARPGVLTVAGAVCIGMATALVITAAVGDGDPHAAPQDTDRPQVGTHQDAGAGESATSGAPQASREPAAATTDTARGSRPESAAASPSQQSVTPTASAAPTATRPAEGAVASAATLLRVAASGGCLTAQRGGLVVSPCVSSPAQKWVLADGNLRSGDLCATVPDGRNADRTPVVMSGCSGLPGQLFTLSSGSLLSVASGKCLDLFGGASGTEVVLWECNGRDNQQWTTA